MGSIPVGNVYWSRRVMTAGFFLCARSRKEISFFEARDRRNEQEDKGDYNEICYSEGKRSEG